MKNDSLHLIWRDANQYYLAIPSNLWLGLIDAPAGVNLSSDTADCAADYPGHCCQLKKAQQSMRILLTETIEERRRDFRKHGFYVENKG